MELGRRHRQLVGNISCVSNEGNVGSLGNISKNNNHCWFNLWYFLVLTLRQEDPAQGHRQFVSNGWEEYVEVQTPTDGWDLEPQHCVSWTAPWRRILFGARR